jgi:transposase
MERIPKAVYSRELREEAVKMITEGGMKAPEVAKKGYYTLQEAGLI